MLFVVKVLACVLKAVLRGVLMQAQTESDEGEGGGGRGGLSLK